MDLSGGPGWDTLIGGDVSERPKELASKASVVQATVGSNPTVTASCTTRTPGVLTGGFCFAGTLARTVSPLHHHRSAGLAVARRSPRRERQLYGRPLVFPASACLPDGNACLADECLRYSASA